MQRRCSMPAASHYLSREACQKQPRPTMIDGDQTGNNEDRRITTELNDYGNEESSVISTDTANNREARNKLYVNSDISSQSFYSLHGIKLIPEGGWGWAVCASGFIVQFIVLGINNSFGILFAFLLNEFGKSKGATAWVGSAAVGILYLFGPITCGLNERIGFRTIAFTGGILCGLGMLLTSFVTEFYKIYVTYSLLWGIGSSLCYFSTVTVPGEYFCRRLSLANGIITAGSGFGTLTFGPLLQFLLKKYGLTTTLRILSAIMSLLALASLTFKRFSSPLEQMYNTQRTPTPFSDMKIWKNKAFVLYTAAVSLFMLGYFIPYVHVVSLVADVGISESNGVMLIGYMSISSTVSRVIFGRLSDYPQVNRLYMTQFAIVGFGAMTLLCPIVKTYKAFVTVMVMLGIFEGMYVVLIAVVITDIVGVHKLNQALGNLYGIISFAITAGPPFAGFLYDALLSYNIAFYICGVTTIFSSLLLFLVPWLIRKDSGRRFERDSIDSRIDSIFSRSMSGFIGINSNMDRSIVYETPPNKSGSRTCERKRKKRKRRRDLSTTKAEDNAYVFSGPPLRKRSFTSDIKETYEKGSLFTRRRPASRQRSISLPSDKEDEYSKLPYSISFASNWTTSSSPISRQRSISFPSDKDDEDILVFTSRLRHARGRSVVSDRDESDKEEDSVFTCGTPTSRQRSVSFPSDKDDEDITFTSSRRSARKRSVSFVSDRDEREKEDDSVFKCRMPTRRQRSVSFPSENDDDDSLFTRRRSVSFPSERDVIDEEDNLFSSSSPTNRLNEYIYDPTYEYDLCDVFAQSHSSTSSGCVLSNSLNTSKNTSFNSTMSFQGSKTKLLLSQFGNNASAYRSAESFKSSSSQQQKITRLARPLFRRKKEIKVMETVV